MQDIKRIELMVKAARLYHEYHQTQQEIASLLNLSRPTVSRLLKEAEEEGIIRITVVNPFGHASELETALEKLFNLKKAIVIPGLGSEVRRVKERLGETAAKYLNNIVRDGDIIAVSWGTTLYEVACRVSPKSLNGVKIVQSNGGVGKNSIDNRGKEILGLFGKALNATSFSLPIPAIVDDKHVAELLKRESLTKEIFDLLEAANIALFSIGIPTTNSVLVEAGYFTPEDFLQLHHKGAVGDICSRYFDIDGEICDPDLNARTIGLELDRLRFKQYSIAVAGGKEKAPGIIGACTAGYVNVLITDEAAAEEIIQHKKHKKE
jgi:deoxyribonucleoside regulator